MRRKLSVGLGIVIALVVVGAITIMVSPGIAEAGRGGVQGDGGLRQSGGPGQTRGQNQDQDLSRVGEQSSEECEQDGTPWDESQGRQGRAGGRRGAQENTSERQASGHGLGQSQEGRLRSDGDEAYDTNLSESEIQALLLALDDEYKAWTVYDQVIVDHGDVRPFANIQRAEEQHIDALVSLFDRYGLVVPTNNWPGAVPTFETVSDACAGGVQAEIDNAALYDQLFALVDNQDIVRVFESLQWASDAKHLPAFERCAD